MNKYQWVVKKKTSSGEEFVPVNEAFPEYLIHFPLFNSSAEAVEGLKNVRFVFEAEKQDFVLVQITYTEVPVIFLKM